MSQVEVEQPTFEDLEVLAEVSQLLTLLDLDSVMQKVITLAAKAVGANKASLFLHDEIDIDWGHILTARELSRDESYRVVSKVMHEGLAGWVMRHKEGTVVYDTEQDDRWIVFADDTLPVRSVLCVPFLFNDRVQAIVTLTHPEPNHFTPYHLRLMTIIANQAVVAIHNAQLFHNVQSQQRQLETVIHAIPAVLLVLDEDGTVLLANDAALSLVGRQLDGAVVGRHIADFVEVDTVFEPVVNIINGEMHAPHWAFEARSERRQQDYQITVAMWQDESRGTAGYVVALHDVTTLRDLHRFKDEMLRVASHDLRSPLALIIGYADMVVLDTPDPESPVHEYVSAIRRSTERMGGLLDDLLRVERIRSSPLELHEEIDFEKLVKIVLVNMRLMADSRQQKLVTQISLAGLPGIVADPVLIRQSMENLIGNATKYTPDGGTITIETQYDDARVYFIVKDTGIGISPEHQRFVFESFYRVDELSGPKGTGLGLSLVKNVIDRHDGEVWVRSEPGRGSEFGFWLPINRE